METVSYVGLDVHKSSVAATAVDPMEVVGCPRFVDKMLMPVYASDTSVERASTDPPLLPTARERKDRIARTLAEDGFVDILPDVQVHSNGSVNIGRAFAGHKSIVIVVQSSPGDVRATPRPPRRHPRTEAMDGP